MTKNDLDIKGLALSIQPKPTDRIENPCPSCKKQGRSVPLKTVMHLVNEADVPQSGNPIFRLCMTPDCAITYYDTLSSLYFDSSQLKVPVWFKRDADPKYACYCAKVTHDEVIDAVLTKGAVTMKEVLDLTGAMRECQCQLKNPLGLCCDKIIQEAMDIGFAKKQSI